MRHSHPSQALNDGTSVSKQEVAVVAMGKLVSSLTMVTEEPYSKYPGLFEGLVKVGLCSFLRPHDQIKAI